MGSQSDVTEASVLWHRMLKVFAHLPGPAAPGLAWRERPVAWLTDLLLHLRVGRERHGENWPQRRDLVAKPPH